MKSICERYINLLMFCKALTLEFSIEISKVYVHVIPMKNERKYLNKLRLRISIQLRSYPDNLEYSSYPDIQDCSSNNRDYGSYSDNRDNR